MVPVVLGEFRTAVGERVYAVGDVHGCWELLLDQLDRIRSDDAARAPARTRIILLGDVVDRGPATRQVLKYLCAMTRTDVKFSVLMGNHEQLMWLALSGSTDALKDWLGVGGDATLRSFGVSDKSLATGAGARVLREARRRIGPELAIWLERLPLLITSGDLVFVHAGVRPGVPLAAQAPRDLLWIRSSFTESDEVRPYLVVHGHTIHKAGPDVRSNRIGLDTGAYETGRLTTMGFEGPERWVLGG